MKTKEISASKFIDLYNKNTSFSQLAKEFNVSKSTIVKLVKTLNLKPRGRNKIIINE